MLYKITISEITETEVPETEYKNTHKKDKNDKDIWEDVETGSMEIKTAEKDVYIQTLESLDIKELAIFINRVR